MFRRFKNDRYMTPELDRITALVADGSIRIAVERQVGKLRE